MFFMNFIRSKAWLYSVLFIYTVFLFIIIFRHEPWFDEAQAWLIARDSNIYELFTRLLRYEGSPGLWHLILMPFAKAGLPYITLNIISGTIAVIGTFIFLNYSPFPLIVKSLYPFTYFAFYQYAVIARSYVLLPPILFLVAINYEDRVLHPYRFVFLLVLLANVSLHGLIISIGLALLYFISLFKQYKVQGKKFNIQYVLSLSVFGIFLFLTLLELKPAPDLITVASLNGHFSNIISSVYMLSDSLINNNSAPVYGYRSFYSALQTFFWFLIVITAIWLYIRKKLSVFLLPLIGLGALFTAVYANVWHQGILFYLWLFTIWISFGSARYENRGSRAIRPVLFLSMIFVFMIQIYWSVNTFNYDFNYKYSASKEAADFIKLNKLYDKKIYMTSFHSASVLPYFPENIFCNFNHGQSPCYWQWSGSNNMYQEPYLDLTKYQPDYILMGVKNYCEKNIMLDKSMIPDVPGYTVVKYFNGSLYWKERPLETDSFVLLKQNEGS